MSIRLQTVPALTGLVWVKKGLRTFFRQPLAMGGIFFLFMGCVSLLSMLPVLGPLLALCITPAGTLGLMVATRQVEQGQFPMPHILFAALRSQEARKPMLQLGLVYGLSFLLVMGISTLIDDGTLAQMYLGEAKPEVEHVDLGALQAAMWMVFLLYLPLAFVFWHAPALVYWHRISPLKSLVFSGLACWRNKGALLVYGVAWMGVMIVISILMGVLIAMLGGPKQVGMIVMPIMMMVAAMFFTSLDFTFRDSFVTDDDTTTRDNSESLKNFSNQ